MDTKRKYLCTVICPKKFTLAHNVFEVIEFCRTRADITHARSDTCALQNTKIYKILHVEVLALLMWAEKELIFI